MCVKGGGGVWNNPVELGCNNTYTPTHEIKQHKISMYNLLDSCTFGVDMLKNSVYNERTLPPQFQYIQAHLVNTKREFCEECLSPVFVHVTVFNKNDVALGIYVVN